MFIGGVYSGLGVFDDGNGMMYFFNFVGVGVGVYMIIYIVNGLMVSDDIEVFDVVFVFFVEFFFDNIGLSSLICLIFMIDNMVLFNLVMDFSFINNLLVGIVIVDVFGVIIDCGNGLIFVLVGGGVIIFLGG